MICVRSVPSAFITEMLQGPSPPAGTPGEDDPLAVGRVVHIDPHVPGLRESGHSRAVGMHDVEVPKDRSRIRTGEPDEGDGTVRRHRLGRTGAAGPEAARGEGDAGRDDPGDDALPSNAPGLSLRDVEPSCQLLPSRTRSLAASSNSVRRSDIASPNRCRTNVRARWILARTDSAEMPSTAAASAKSMPRNSTRTRASRWGPTGRGERSGSPLGRPPIAAGSLAVSTADRSLRRRRLRRRLRCRFACGRRSRGASPSRGPGSTVRRPWPAPPARGPRPRTDPPPAGAWPEQASDTRHRTAPRSRGWTAYLGPARSRSPATH